MDIKRSRLINDKSIEEEIENAVGDVKTLKGKNIICVLHQLPLMIPGDVTGEETKVTNLPICFQNWIQDKILQFDKKFDCRIIYDIIRKRSLRKAIYTGAKILHLELFFHKPDYLLIEDAYTGRLCQIGFDEILKMIGADGGTGQSENGDG